MKTYLLSFNANDFVKSNNVWTTSSIDLYHNKFYTNYSLKKSAFGLNSLEDYTFTGTEILPSATPTIPGAYQVTNYGELISDENVVPHYVFTRDSMEDINLVFDPDIPSTPIFTADSYVSELRRFIDTSSRIDIRTFKGAFSSSLNSLESITFDLNIYESDTKNRTVATFVYFYFNRCWKYSLIQGC
jgi:hypothetical protein